MKEVSFVKIVCDMKKYFLVDQESGYQYEVSKEYYERFNKSYEDCKPKSVNGLRFGNMIFLGTGGDIDGIDYTESFYQTGLVKKPSQLPWLELNTDNMKIIPNDHKLDNKYIPTTEDLERAAKLINEFNEFTKTIDDAPFFTQANKFIEHLNKKES